MDANRKKPDLKFTCFGIDQVSSWLVTTILFEIDHLQENGNEMSTKKGGSISVHVVLSRFTALISSCKWGQTLP